MTTVLVANRGEVVLRVFRTARRMGMRCAAVYSDADAGAPFVRAADAAVRVGPPSPADSYLRIDRIIEAARETGADVVHPGYGFLAEDADFAEACLKAGLAFAGPPPGVLRAMGAKDEAKRIASAAGVPVLPGYAGDDQSEEAFARAAGDIGYPVIVKPAAGGGGKGMAVARGPDGLPAVLASARRLAAAAFGDDRLLIERYLEDPRHVEVQIVADAHGTVVHLGERDCSLQRRHQKALEETPSPAVDDALRARLCDAAVELARRVGYASAGTCEFVLGPVESHPPRLGFIEMNARLQVEHPVTEMVTGLDLVELQLRIATGERLSIRQEDVRFAGHAIEARVYAEDPRRGFLPQAGRVEHVRWPEGARVDAGVDEGDEVSAHYDPMLAKVIVHGADRADALSALRRALDGCQVLGPRTNLALLRAVAADPVLAAGAVTTTWLERAWAAPAPAAVPDDAVALAAGAEAGRILAARRRIDPWDALGPWRADVPAPVLVALRPDGEELVVAVRPRGRELHALGRRVAPLDAHHEWEVDDVGAAAARGDGEWFVWWDGEQREIPIGLRERRAGEAGASHLEAPMPGQVAAVRVSAGDRVSRGQELVVVEAMKMEHPVVAPVDGVVRAVLCAPGDQVERGQTLVDVEPA